jgi:hypothetical protein
MNVICGGLWITKNLDINMTLASQFGTAKIAESLSTRGALDLGAIESRTDLTATKRPEATASGLSFQWQVILALDEALLEHLLVAEPKIGDVG